jgi:hypothetical protein
MTIHACLARFVSLVIFCSVTIQPCSFVAMRVTIARSAKLI